MLWRWWRRRRQRKRRERQKWRFWRKSKRAAIAFHDSLVDLHPPLISSSTLRPQLRKSLARLRAAASHSRFSFSLQFRIAEALRILERNGDAIAVLEKLERRCLLVGDSHMGAVAFIQMGLILNGMGEYEASTRTLLRGLAYAQEARLPPNIDQLCWLNQVKVARYTLGKQLFYLNDYENALVHLHDVDFPIDAHYFSAAAQFKIALHLSSNRKQGALNHCQTYLELCCDARACHLMGRIYVMLKDYEQGMHMNTRAACLAQEEEDFELESYYWWQSGCILTESLRRHDDAIVNFNSSIDAALRVKDSAEHTLCLFRAASWLKRTLALNQGISTDKWWKFTGSQTETPIIQLDALCTLGEARVHSGMFDEARQHFQNAFGLIDEEGSVESSLLLRLHWGLAQVSSALWEQGEALQLYKKCRKIAQTEETKLWCDIYIAKALNNVFKFNEACEAWSRALEEYCTLLEREWESKAELLLGFGRTLCGMGNHVEAVSKLEAAREILEERQQFDSKLMGWIYLSLFYAYLENQNIWHVFQLAKSYQAVMSASMKERHHHKQVWQYMVGVASSSVGDKEEANKALTKILENELNLAEPSSGWIWKCGMLTSLANAYRNLGDFEGALAKYAEAINLVPERDLIHIGNVCINRASLYLQMADRQSIEMVEGQATIRVTYWKAYDDYERAISIYDPLSYTASLAIAYAGQAAILSKLADNLDVALEKLEKAQNFAGKNMILIARLKYIRALIYYRQGALAEAHSENREAALHFAGFQVELQDLDSAWITLLGGEMKSVFFHMQYLCKKLDNHLQALLWAERSRMRLYFRSMGQDPLWFDKDDRLAKECIYQAIHNCGSETAFVEYTYSEGNSLLYIFLVKEQESELRVHFHKVKLIDFFAIKSNSVGCKTLRALIKRTRSDILKRADDKAMKGLSILYRLLVEPVWQNIAGCSNVIFAPHEDLSLVPFAALYIDGQKSFLIEHKAVGIIPSIRTVHQCLMNQSEFESRMRAHKLAPAFVAGDPQPMGLKLKQLKGAAEEASTVARILGVKPLIGPEMTKQAVINGLSNACVSVVVTHGTVDSYFPHGALVMQRQGRHGCNCDQDHLAAPDLSLRNLALRGLPAGTIDINEGMSRASEVLTADEIAALEGGIHAGLVVLSACQTGEGKVSSEGTRKGCVTGRCFFCSSYALESG